VLQAAGLDPALSARLSSQLARARAAVSGAQSSTWGSIGRFAVISFPATAYRIRWWWLGSAIGSILVAVLLGWWVARSPSVQASLLPKSQVANLVRHQFSGYYSQYAAQSFAARVWTNNVLVAASAVIAGILLGIPVILALFENAANGGIIGGLMISHGRAAEFWGLILPHGMLELTAVFLAAGAGLRLGWTVIDPGARPRSQAIAEAGRQLVTIALGLIVVLAVSGVIEAFVTPSPLSTWVRIGIGACAEAAFLGYVIILGRRATAAGETGDIAEAPDVVPVSG
jgi:uncharacterized membrane protein SpoIIM required for sporulation